MVVDGCFLECIGRIMGNVIDKGKIIHVDTNPAHRKYEDVFLYTDVSEETRKEVAHEVAEKGLEKLREEQTAVHLFIKSGCEKNNFTYT